MLKQIFLICSAALLSLALVSLPVQAGTTTTTFPVSATVVASCAINSAGAMAFGNYDPVAAAATTSTSTISINCTKNTPYTIALNYGAHGGTAANRIMQDSGTDTLNYNLYTDSGYSNVWQDTTTCSTVPNASSNCDGGTGAGPGSGNAQTYTVYGEIPAGQNAAAATYNDTITVTVTF